MTAEKCFSHGNDDGMGWVARVKNGFLGREIDIAVITVEKAAHALVDSRIINKNHL